MHHPLLDTFPLSHPRRRAVERAFELDFKRIEHVPKGPVGACYAIVDAMVNDWGGESVLGWQILHWPGRYVEALHHAIWLTPDDELIDVTEKYPTDHRDFTTFAFDNSISVDSKLPGFIPSKFFALEQSVRVKEVIAASVHQIASKAAHRDEAVALGGEWTGNYHYTGILHPTVRLIDLTAQIEVATTRVSLAFDTLL
jgi:hypothetical protein